MAIYEMANDGIRAIKATSYAAVGILERGDLQRLLRDSIDVICPETLVIAEEFGEWEDSRRRIDLLGIDKDANLVVIELKRTDDGGHMELQAVRYAAMVSAMTFENAVGVFRRFLRLRGRDEDPEAQILKHLGWDEPNEDEFAQDVRIVLAAADFSRELTTAVMWLNDHGLDITCMRLKPYRDGDRVLLDVQQIIPLPEAEDYRVRIREKQERERSARRSGRGLVRFDVTINGRTQCGLPREQAIFEVVRHLCSSGVSPEKVAECIRWRPTNLFARVPDRVDSQRFLERVPEHYSRFNPDRFFCDDSELIQMNDSTYAFTRIWGPRTGEAIENLLRAFPDMQVKCEPHRPV